MTDCFDHVGAVLGALFTGAMFVPVLGVSVTCAVTAAFSAVGSVFVLWSARHPPRESSRRSP
jgi:predicted MFS family arabinose efflux permease